MARAECNTCGETWTGTLFEVSEAVDDHEEFHDVQIERAVADGGVESQQFFVVDEERSAVIDGPFDSADDARTAVKEAGPGHMVASKALLELVAMTSQKMLRWETDELDVVTDGGHPPAKSGGANHPATSADAAEPETAEERLARMLDHPPGKPHHCDICDTWWETPLELYDHACDEHDDEDDQEVATDGGVRRRASTPHSVRTLAGVADQTDECPNGTEGCPGPDAPSGTLPCTDCFLGGED